MATITRDQQQQRRQAAMEVQRILESPFSSSDSPSTSSTCTKSPHNRQRCAFDVLRLSVARLQAIEAIHHGGPPEGSSHRLHYPLQQQHDDDNGKCTNFSSSSDPHLQQRKRALQKAAVKKAFQLIAIRIHPDKLLAADSAQSPSPSATSKGGSAMTRMTSQKVNAAFQALVHARDAAMAAVEAGLEELEDHGTTCNTSTVPRSTPSCPDTGKRNPYTSSRFGPPKSAEEAPPLSAAEAAKQRTMEKKRLADPLAGMNSQRDKELAAFHLPSERTDSSSRHAAFDRSASSAFPSMATARARAEHGSQLRKRPREDTIKSSHIARAADVTVQKQEDEEEGAAEAQWNPYLYL